jgi:hypothetical protein
MQAVVWEANAPVGVVPAHSASKTRINALREPGPIRRSRSRGHGVWVPAFAGTTSVNRSLQCPNAFLVSATISGDIL